MGGTGFIGRNMTNYFSNLPNYDVTATHFESPTFNDETISWLQVDLRDPHQVEEAITNFDIVIQAAATTSGIKDAVSRPDYHVTDNAVMNSLVFRRASQAKVKHLIFFSCTTMLQSSESPQIEDDFNANDEVYSRYFGVGWTKVYLEKMCEFFSRHSETKFTVIRHSNVYGPWDKYDLEKSHVFGATITKVLLATDSIEIWGDGSEKRDLLYITDLVEFVKKALDNQKDKFRIYNCGGNVLVSTRELTERIMSIAERNLEIHFNTDKPTVKFSVCLDNKRAKDELGWSPRVELDMGIRLSLDFWKEHIKI